MAAHQWQQPLVRIRAAGVFGIRLQFLGDQAWSVASTVLQSVGKHLIAGNPGLGIRKYCAQAAEYLHASVIEVTKKNTRAGPPYRAASFR